MFVLPFSVWWCGECLSFPLECGGEVRRWTAMGEEGVSPRQRLVQAKHKIKVRQGGVRLKVSQYYTKLIVEKINLYKTIQKMI